MARARFMVDLGDLKLSAAQQKEIAHAIQGAVLQKLAHHLPTRPHIDLAKAPGREGWAGAMIATTAAGLEKLKKKHAWGRPRGGSQKSGSRRRSST
jgi:hypothetical protein